MSFTVSFWLARAIETVRRVVFIGNGWFERLSERDFLIFGLTCAVISALAPNFIFLLGAVLFLGFFLARYFDALHEYSGGRRLLEIEKRALERKLKFYLLRMLAFGFFVVLGHIVGLYFLGAIKT